MKIRVIIPHPTIKPHHVKHAAAVTTASAGVAEAFAPYHIGAILFVIAGCIAIYEPYFVNEVHVSTEEEEEYAQ